MKLFVGLGNPGAKYASNRHNIGFMALDRIQARLAAGPWRSRFQGHASDASAGGKRLLLLKPHTYMNESGRAVAEAVRFLKIAPADVIVFHDELDLAPGKVRVKIGGGHAGHNGLRSIAAQIGAEFVRVRIGIGHPGAKELVSGYVLHDFAKSDAAWVEPLLDKVADDCAVLAAGDVARFQALIGQSASGEAGGLPRGRGGAGGKGASEPATISGAGGSRGTRAAHAAKQGRAVGPNRPSQRDLARRAAAHREAVTEIRRPPIETEENAEQVAPQKPKGSIADQLARLFGRKAERD